MAAEQNKNYKPINSNRHLNYGGTTEQNKKQKYSELGVSASPPPTPPMTHQPLLQHCSQSCRISGHSSKTLDKTHCKVLSLLSACKRMTFAANTCLTGNADISRHLNTTRAIKTTIISASGDADPCFVQQVNRCIIAPGLLAHHSFKAAPACKMHLLPQGSTINPNSTTVTNITRHTLNPLN